MSRLAIFLLTACLGASAMAADTIDANRKKDFGDITVHYNTFTSSFLPRRDRSESRRGAQQGERV